MLWQNWLLLVRSKNFQLRKGLKERDKDESKTQEEMQMSGNGEEDKKKVTETAPDLGDSDKEVELGEKEEHEQDVTEALLVLETIQIEEKTSLEDVKGTELKQDVCEE